MRIGLLLPNSNFITRLAADIRRWLVLGLEENGSAGELFIEACGYNEKASTLREKLQHLVMRDDVDLIVAPLNPGMVSHIADLLPGQQTPLVTLTMGEDVVEGDTAPPWLFVNSFGLWRSAWLNGWHAVHTHGPKICTMSAAHEGGYGLAFAAALGVEAAGGEIAAALPLPMQFTADHVAAHMSVAIEVAANAIILLASGEAQDAVSAALAGPGGNPGAIAITGFAPHAWLPGGRRPDAGAPASALFSSWDPGAPSSAAFIDRFVADNNSPAHAYALMAYEAGGLIAAALSGGQGPMQGEGLCQALAAATFDGPRGPASFDPQTQEINQPQHLLESRDGGALVVCKGDTPEIPELLAEQVALARQKVGKSGWLNPYLVA